MMWGVRVVRLLILALLGASCVINAASSALALTDEEAFRELRFNLVSPGGRALAMGGASVAMANDATAAGANPAGLHYVDAPQFFVEFRTVDEDVQVFRSELGSLDVDPTSGERDLPFLGLTSVTVPDTATDPSFVSFVWPLRLGTVGRRLNLAWSRQVVLSQDHALQSADSRTELRASFEPFPNTVNNGEVEAYSVAGPVSGESSIEVIYWNAGASLEVHPDFSLGVSVSYATLDLRSDSVTRVEDPLELFLDPGHPRLPAQPTADILRTSIDDSDDGFAYTLGVHWHPDSVFAGGSPWWVGAVYRKGARFYTTESVSLNDVRDRRLKNTVVVPDRYSVGATYRTDGPWTFSAEVEKVEYSDMLEDFKSGVNFLTSERVADFFPVDPERTVEFDVDNAIVPRLGAEWARDLGGGRRRLSFALGYFRSPDSRIRMVDFNSTDEDVNAVYLDAFREGEDDDHLTAGVGFRMGRSTFHLAGAFSDWGTQLIGSYSLQFGQR